MLQYSNIKQGLSSLQATEKDLPPELIFKKKDKYSSKWAGEEGELKTPLQVWMWRLLLQLIFSGSLQ